MQTHDESEYGFTRPSQGMRMTPRSTPGVVGIGVHEIYDAVVTRKRSGSFEYSGEAIDRRFRSLLPLVDKLLAQ